MHPATVEPTLAAPDSTGSAATITPPRWCSPTPWAAAILDLRVDTPQSDLPDPLPATTLRVEADPSTDDPRAGWAIEYHDLREGEIVRLVPPRGLAAAFVCDAAEKAPIHPWEFWPTSSVMGYPREAVSDDAHGRATWAWIERVHATLVDPTRWLHDTTATQAVRALRCLPEWAGTGWTTWLDAAPWEARFLGPADALEYACAIDDAARACRWRSTGAYVEDAVRLDRAGFTPEHAHRVLAHLPTEGAVRDAEAQAWQQILHHTTDLDGTPGLGPEDAVTCWEAGLTPAEVDHARRTGTLNLTEVATLAALRRPQREGIIR